MICPSCRYDNPDAARFCGGCGQPLSMSVACPRCGAENPRGQKFCNGCGQRITLGLPPPPAQVRDPRSYTPKHLAEKILRSKSALEGELKQVTVLFADVQGSLSLSEDLDPEALHRIMDNFFGILAEGVHRFEGTVNQYTGDGIMALFGAPIAHEDHAQRACYAALHLTSELRRYADELRLTQGVNFAVRMGLNSGEVVVGKIGDDLRMDYTAQGRTVGLAARMEQLAEPGKAYLTNRTARLVQGFFQLRDLGRSVVKGMKEPITIFELEGVGPIRTRLDMSRSRGFSRFVGRTDEMAALESALECATVCDAQVVGVVGEAGVGKSRLCLEVVERCRARGTPVYEAHCPAHGKTVPFLPFLQLLRSYFDVSERDSDQKVRETITGRLVLLDREFEEALPLLFEFLGVPDPTRPAPRMDRGTRQRRLLGFAQRLVQATSARELSILFVDDVHWIDPGSDAFLAHIAAAVIGTRTTLLVNFRPEYHAPWMNKPHYQQLSLAPLGREAVDELLGHLLGDDPSVVGLHGLIRERAGGNPFFIEELVQSLIESGSLQGAPGGYRLTKPIEEPEIPGSVKSLLAARIDRLPDREKHVLQTAAVIGKTFSESVLSRVVDLPGKDLAASMGALQAADLVHEQALYPQMEYAFKHPLTQEVAYQSQLSQRRARIHASVARAIEVGSPARLEENAALLAHHWEEAAEATEAAKWHRRAAEWAGMNSAEAAHHWMRVRDLLDTVPQEGESLSHGAAARAQTLWHQIRMGISEEQAAALFKEGHDLASRSQNKPALALILNSYGLFRLYSGAVREALEFADAAVREADLSGDPGLRIAVRWTLLAVHFSAGRLDDCVKVIDEALPIGEHDFDLGADIQGYSPYLFMLALRGYALAARARLNQGARDLERAMDLSRAHGNAFNLASTHLLYVNLCDVSGDEAGALTHGRRAAELTGRMGNPVANIWSSQALGHAYALNRRWDEAASVLEPALALARKHRTFLQMEPDFLVTLARVSLGSGKGEQALERVEEAVRLADRYGTQLFDVRAHLMLSHVLLRIGDQQWAEKVEAALARAQALIEKTGAAGFVPRLHEQRAALARVLGDDEKRGHELREAHRLFTAMGATGHAERIAKRLGL